MSEQPSGARDISHKRAAPVGDPGKAVRKAGTQMFLAIAIILAIIWLICWLGVHITVAAIHILIVLAVISLIVHFVRGRRRV